MGRAQGDTVREGGSRDLQESLLHSKLIADNAPVKSR